MRFADLVRIFPFGWLLSSPLTSLYLRGFESVAQENLTALTALYGGARRPILLSQCSLIICSAHSNSLMATICLVSFLSLHNIFIVGA